MDKSNWSDDEIELLNPPTEDQSNENEQTQELFVSQIPFLHRGPSEEESINPSSYHALQTAVTSMQQKLNDKTKKYNELMQKNKLMQKALFDMSKQNGGMDDLCPQEPSIVHAAGAGSGCSSEDEAAIAEQRARQGYISHLEREVLRNTSSIARANEEIQRLKRKLDEQEREKKSLLQRIDQFHMDNEMLTRTSENNKIKENRLEELEQQQKYLYQENLSLKEQIEIIDKNNPKDAEIRDLKTKLTVAENEMTKLTLQFRELDRKMQEKEEELSRLKSKCKQYDIEAEINRKRRLADSTDEVDGDNDVLLKALDMIQSQRSEMTNLMSEVHEQKNTIKELMVAKEKDSIKPVCKCKAAISEKREDAQGASIQFQYEEQRCPQSSGSPVFVNTHPVQEHLSSQARRETSPVARRHSDRRDSRGVNRQSPKPTSPRLRENFVPTGSTHIPEMLANEDMNLTRRHIGSNVFDNNSSRPPHFSPRSLAESPQPMYMNISATQGSNSHRQDPETAGRVNSPQVSPRPSNNLYQNMEVTSQFPPQPGVSNSIYGARQKTNYAHDDRIHRNYFDAESPVMNTSNRIPDRMTQSAILLRDDSDHDETAMSRSLYSPIINVGVNDTQCNDLYQVAQQDNLVYRRNIRPCDNGPDYENIFNVKPETISRRTPDEHEDRLSATDAHNTNDLNQSGSVRQPATGSVAAVTETEESDISALKICPVCNLEFSRMTMDQFQTHVFECFDNCEEPQTLQTPVAAADDDRHCPMCAEVFPMTIPQETFEQHVLAHFGEEPMMERFEMLNS